jgi:hypothetical protein
LDSFGRIVTFQWVTGEKNEKFLFVSTRLSGCARGVSGSPFSRFFRAKRLGLTRRDPAVEFAISEDHSRDFGFGQQNVERFVKSAV